VHAPLRSTESGKQEHKLQWANPHQHKSVHLLAQLEMPEQFKTVLANAFAGSIMSSGRNSFLVLSGDCLIGDRTMSLTQFQLEGKVALVTGGSKGLGAAMSRALALAGADVLISSRHEDELARAAAQITAGTQRRCAWYVADMGDRQAVIGLGEWAKSRFGKVDILVNNAGTNKPQAIDSIDDETWDSVMEINLNSVMALTRSLVPEMKKRQWGRVIHISSIMGVLSKEKRNVYSATKSALLGLCRASALDLGAFGITVNCLSPGPFLTDLPASVLSEAEKKAFSDHTALGRWGNPEELTGPLLLLASDAGRYITGCNLLVDGGFTIR
jgi:NAD(P)-dependent dehydrogenase (short-subunit alcohol dehydrogenase family)